MGYCALGHTIPYQKSKTPTNKHGPAPRRITLQVQLPGSDHHTREHTHAAEILRSSALHYQRARQCRTVLPAAAGSFRRRTGRRWSRRECWSRRCGTGQRRTHTTWRPALPNSQSNDTRTRSVVASLVHLTTSQAASAKHPPRTVTVRGHGGITQNSAAFREQDLGNAEFLTGICPGSARLTVDSAGDGGVLASRAQRTRRDVTGAVLSCHAVDAVLQAKQHASMTQP